MTTGFPFGFQFGNQKYKMYKMYKMRDFWYFRLCCVNFAISVVFPVRPELVTHRHSCQHTLFSHKKLGWAFPHKLNKTAEGFCKCSFFSEKHRECFERFALGLRDIRTHFLHLYQRGLWRRKQNYISGLETPRSSLNFVVVCEGSLICDFLKYPTWCKIDLSSEITGGRER